MQNTIDTTKRGGLALAALGLVLGAAPLAAADPGAAVPAAAATGTYQVRASELILGDGSRLEDAVLLIEDGKVARVGKGVEVDASLPLIDHDGVVAPGWVALSTQSGARGEAEDLTRSLIPAARLAYAVDRDHSDLRAALEAGITTFVLTPTRRDLVGGLSAVVKSAGGELVKADAHLAIALTRDAIDLSTGNVGFFFGASEAPLAADGGPEDTDEDRRGTREPTSFPGAVRMLRERFEAGEGAYGLARQGQLPVLIEAWDRNEVARAIDLVRTVSLRGAIRGAPLAGDLVEPLREAGLGVVLGPFADDQTRPSLASVRALGDAGVPMAFALDGPASSAERLRLSAAKAIAAGADPVVVWKALTSDAARIAGVDDRVGTLQRGRDADFVLWSGDPLDLGSRVEAVYVGGRRVYARERELPRLGTSGGAR